MITTLISLLVTATPALNVSVEGDGFLRFAHSGTSAFSTHASLSVANGVLTNAAGDILLPQVHVPAAAKRIDIELDGTISATTDAGKTVVGHIVLAIFASGNPDGKPKLGNPGDGLNGVIRCSAGSTKQASSGTPGKKNPAKSTANVPTKPTITFSQKSEVDGDIVLLSDIATIEGDPSLTAKIGAADLGRSPLYGASKGITLSYVLAHLRMCGIKTDDLVISIPPNCVVGRKAQTIGSDAMVEAATKAAKEKLGIDVPLKLDSSINDVVAPTGTADISVRDIQKGQNGVTAVVWISVDGKSISSRYLTLVPAEGGIGVKSGEVVKIRLMSHGAIVEVQGKAKTAGWVGSTVTVISDTGTTHTGVVKGDGSVEVKL